MAMLPLHDTMKKILEKDNYLSEMLAEIKKPKDSHNFTNIVQSSLWKKKCELYPEKVLIPYFLFIDDLELNNPLGSHASKDSIFIYEDVAADAVKRLRYENVDASELNELWQLSSSSRLEKIVNDCLSLSDIFKLWPEYKKPTGYRLIDLDFKHLYSSANDILDIFEPKMKKLYDFFSKPNTLKDSNCSVLLKKLTDDVVAKGDTSYIFTTLWCLHEYLFPTGRVVQKDNTGKKITRRFTIKDSQESVCFVGQSVQQLEQFISFQKSRNLNI
ncbi:uncharacterized protein LOC119664116 [Teleopsis dalmanni]|uniref:uncharacterized protein LOC119664116 n=1 Tax=Teleopsis dalmanni TaxID=139649 RepID=UPI0018CF0969|nr:uncharacterized protein LOC119664116 [Teleopsis dalmanni]